MKDVIEISRKVFLVGVREHAHVLPDVDVEATIVVALRVLADNLSEYGTEQFCAFMPNEWRQTIGRAREKVEHSPDDMIEIVAQQAQIQPAAADQILTAIYKQLWLELPQEQMRSLINQCPSRLAHVLRGCKPGQKRGAF